MMDKLQQEAILGAAVGQLNLLDGLTAKVAPNAEGDIVHVQYGPFDTPFRVVAKAEPGDPFGRVLIAQYVKQRQAETLKNQGVNFIDTLGNAYLRGPNFLLWVTGRTPERLHRTDLPHQAPPQVELLNRAFEPKGLQVVFALLCRPDTVALPYRAVGRLADVAHGTVGHVVNDLEALGFVARGPVPKGKKRGPRKLVNMAGLLEEWAQVFAKTVRHRHLLGRYRGVPLDDAGKLRWADYGAQLGGEFAADAVTQYLHPETLTLYIADERPGPGLLRDLRLQPDPTGPIEILRKFWMFDAPVADHTGLVPLPLVYADLVALGGPRRLETAGMVRERILAD